MLLSALAAVPEPPALIAGDGPLRPHLQAQARRWASDRAYSSSAPWSATSGDDAWQPDVLAVPSIELADGRTGRRPPVVLEGLARWRPCSGQPCRRDS